jgi:large subunit ribosomal protein L17
MLKNLTTSLLKHQRITTTHARAKEVQKLAEKLITLAKKSLDSKQSLSAKRHVFRYISDMNVASDLFERIAPQYAEGAGKEERKGGFTRIIQIKPRQGDAAPMVFLELV